LLNDLPGLARSTFDSPEEREFCPELREKKNLISGDIYFTFRRKKKKKKSDGSDLPYYVTGITDLF